MLFQAVVIFLPISIFFKILSNGGKVHCHKIGKKSLAKLVYICMTCRRCCYTFEQKISVKILKDLCTAKAPQRKIINNYMRLKFAKF